MRRSNEYCAYSKARPSILPVRVAAVPAALRIFRVARDAEIAHRGVAEDRAVAGEGVQQHFAAAREGLQRFGVDLRIEQHRRPDGHDDPGVGGGLVDGVVNRRFHRHARRIHARLEAEHRRREAGMHVRVVDAGDDHASVEIDDLRSCAGQRLDLGGRADGGNAIAFDGNRFGPRSRSIAGEDFAGQQDQRWFGLGDCAEERTEEKESEGHERDASHHPILFS